MTISRQNEHHNFSVAKFIHQPMILCDSSAPQTNAIARKQLRESERYKIECARRHFETIAGSSITYGVVTKYDDLRAIITK